MTIKIRNLKQFSGVNVGVSDTIIDYGLPLDDEGYMVLVDRDGRYYTNITDEVWNNKIKPTITEGIKITYSNGGVVYVSLAAWKLGMYVNFDNLTSLNTTNSPYGGVLYHSEAKGRDGTGTDYTFIYHARGTIQGSSNSGRYISGLPEEINNLITIAIK